MATEVTKPITKKKRKKMGKRQINDCIAAYVLIAPVVIGLGVFYIWPFFQNVWFSFNDVNKFNVATFNGIENYVELFQDPDLWGAFWNTILYIVITTPVIIVLSLAVAALLNTKIKGKSIYRTLYFLPTVTMPVAVSLVWRWIFNGEFGLLNEFLGAFGIEGEAWLANADTALYMVMIVAIWSGVGYNVIILLAGMQGISKSYYEAAAIDGATGLQCFRKITVPLVSPSLFFILITGMISAFQVFDTIYMMIGIDSPIYGKVLTMNALFYQNAFVHGQKGYAAAISMFTFVIIMIVTIIQLRVQKRWVNYD